MGYLIMKHCAHSYYRISQRNPPKGLTKFYLIFSYMLKICTHTNTSRSWSTRNDSLSGFVVRWPHTVGEHLQVLSLLPAYRHYSRLYVILVGLDLCWACTSLVEEAGKFITWARKMCYCLWLISMVLIKGFVFTITACVCVWVRGGAGGDDGG